MAKLQLFFGNCNKFPKHLIGRYGITFLFAVLATLPAFAQQIEIRGKILDEGSKVSVIGATVKLKSKQGGTISDTNGNYSLNVSKLPVTLYISAVGYKYQEIDVYEAEPTTIYLTEDQNRLSEVVVTGYSTQERKNISGSITTVKNNDLSTNPASSLNEKLQGKATGVQVSSNSGVPGGGVTFRVRGINSINAGVDPLYIVDGVFISNSNLIQTGLGSQAPSNPLADINPDDIEDLVILKDANATAIYGSLGANGVVIITTKRGKQNSKAKINFNASHGWSTATNIYKVASGPETAKLFNESAVNTALDNGKAASTAVLVSAQPDTLKTYDRFSDLFRTAATSNYELSAQGGTNNSSYFISLGYLKQESVVKPSDFERYSGRFNYDVNITSKLKVATSFSLARTWRNVSSNDNNPIGVINSALYPKSYLPIYNADGTYARYGSFDNHIALINNLNNDAVGFRTIDNLYAEYTFFPGLKLRSSWSIDNNDLYENNYSNTLISAGIASNGSASSYESKNQILTNEQVLTFVKSFGTNKKHSVNALIGNTVSSNLYQATSASGTGFATNDLTAISVAATRSGSSSRSESKLVSYFTKASYTYDDKYTVDASLRADASTKFGKNKQWGYFPSGGFTWRAGNEKFIKNLRVFDELKFRGSIGLSGNQDGIGAYSSQGVWSAGYNYLDLAGTAPSRLDNPDLTWETTRQVDLGTEFQVLKNRLSVTIDYYNKYTYDLLLNVPVPYRSGFSSYLQNYGAVSNKGFEFGLHSENIKSRGFEWTTDFNISFNQNKIEKLPSDISLGASGRNISILRQGYAINSFQLYKQLSVDPQTGNAIYEDISGPNGKPDGKITSADRQIVGSALPNFTGGFTNNFSYKGFELNIFFYFQQGNKIMNMNEFFMVHGGAQKNIGFLPLQSDRWQKPGDITDIPRLTTFSGDPDVNGGSANNYGGNVANLSSRYLEDGSFIRLKNISLSYNIPFRIIKKLGISNFKLYVNATNLLTFTNYKGLDPEVSSQGSNQNTAGYDWATVPQSKTFTTGINVTF
jgi:TonB-linked SusC/RagA family outer membrane protein